MSSVANASDAVVLGRRQLYMLPTRHGLMFCVLLAVLLLASVNYGNGLGYALTFLLGAVAVVSMLHTHRNLHRLRVAAGPCVPVFAGAAAHVDLAAPAPRRGWLAAPEFTLATEFPLGLLYSWSRRIRLASRCLVYPQPAPPQPFPAAAAGSVRPGRTIAPGAGAEQRHDCLKALALPPG